MWGGALGAAARERDQDSRSIIVAILFIEKKSFFLTDSRVLILFFPGSSGGDHFLCFIPSIQWDMFFGGKAFLRVP